MVTSESCSYPIVPVSESPFLSCGRFCEPGILHWWVAGIRMQCVCVKGGGGGREGGEREHCVGVDFHCH